MAKDSFSWERLKRKVVYDTKFLKVYEDTVKLPNGQTIDDYSVVQKPSIVMIVASDIDNKVIILSEYKYAANETLLTLPAGHIKEGEDPLLAAKRELLEETGYGCDEFEESGILYDYPTKDLHKVYVVQAKNVKRVAKTEHEETEQITYELYSPQEIQNQINNREWKASSALAALTLTGILF